MTRGSSVLCNWLKKYEVTKGSDFTHTSLDNPKGSYYIPCEKIDEFQELYTHAVANKQRVHMTEKHRDMCHVLIDLDFRQDTLERVYTEGMLKSIITSLHNVIEEYLDVSHVLAFVMEKPPRVHDASKGIYKDGIHIVFPNVVTKADFQYFLRRETMLSIAEILEPCRYLNNIDDIYDKAVIERNNWFMYGSNKPIEQDKWVVTKIYDANTLEITDPSNFELEALVNILSIRNKYDATPYKPGKTVPQVPHDDDGSTAGSNAHRSFHIEYELVRDLVMMLKPERSNSYESWIKVGWCLHNMEASKSMLDLWIEFSKRSSKYQDGECEKLWQGMRVEGLNIGSLRMWAKEDDPQKYKELINKSIFAEIKECNGMHNSIAVIASKILKGKYVCALPNAKLWYEFDGTLWKEDKEAIHLRHDLSTIVREQFILSFHILHRSLRIDDLDSTGSTTNSRKQVAEIGQRLVTIASKLQDACFKDNVVREMREYFYDGDFLKKLDSNKHLLAFRNGVWDFQYNSFRTATPEDYLSINVGYEYKSEIDESKRQVVEEYWKKLHPNETQRNYILNMLAQQLYGDSGNELFHIHAGHQNSAGNGKTKFFEMLESCLGDYVRKFPVQVLTAKVREEAGKPAPEYQYWKGRRIMYCTEPKIDDVLHSGIMKDLTGGEKILYRLCYGNDVHEFRPQYKMHIMCNDPPKVDGSDEGVRRRIRKLDYISKFVESDKVNESMHYYKRDTFFFDSLRDDARMKMEALRYILERYDKNNEYQMPDVIKENSRMYLDDNDCVSRFIKDNIEADADSYFTLSEAKYRYKQCGYSRVDQLRNDLVKALKTECHEQKKVKGTKLRSVFMGYKLIEESIIEDDGL